MELDAYAYFHLFFLLLLSLYFLRRILFCDLIFCAVENLECCPYSISSPNFWRSMIEND